MTDIQCIYSFL